MTVEQWLGTENNLGIDIWHKKYQNNNESFDEWLDRISSNDEKLKQLIIEKKFLFGGRILASRGLNKQGKKITYSNCYVLSPPEDNIESIFECASKLARTFSYGGGVGIDISKLAPRGAKVNNAAKETTGSVSFMNLYSLVTELIGQEGRRGALMLSISCDHPDLEEFINIKSDLNKVTKANLSIRVTDEFMNAVKNDSDFTLKFTRNETGEQITKTVKAKDIFRKFALMNYDYAEPAFLYWDRIEKWNLLSNNSEFSYSGVNPCAEEPLPAGGSCLLGSLNLSEFVLNPYSNNAKFSIESFKKAVRIAVKALNDVLDEGLSLHPLQEQRDSVTDWRQIGLGIMGLSDMLIKMGIVYGSEESIKVCDLIGLIMNNSALVESAYLATTECKYPKCNMRQVKDTEYFKKNSPNNSVNYITLHGLRNSQLLTIAPTGTLSTMLGISGGIEPIYAMSYNRKTESLHSKEFYYKVYTPIVKEYMTINNITDEKDLPNYFITSKDIPYKNRIDMQSVWQTHIDASISSTINLPEETTVEQIEELYMYAWKKGLKGITLYRNGCKRSAVLSEGNSKTEEIKTVTEFPRGMIENVPREDLRYRTYKLKTGCGNLYLFVGVDEEEGRIYDIFTNTDGTGGCQINTQANSRLISACMRGGVPIEYIVDQLNKSGTCASFQYKRGKGEKLSSGKSCASAIANVLSSILNEFKDDVVDKEEPIQQPLIKDNSGKVCPECKQHSLIFEGGCSICKSCGYSKCS
jgi:ribonucleoside-diphosphate reductase alpha chain